MYTQCKLQRGDTIQVAWIEAKYAKEGNIVDLVTETKDLDKGWNVVETYMTISDEAFANQKERVHKGIFASIK